MIFLSVHTILDLVSHLTVHINTVFTMAATTDLAHGQNVDLGYGEDQLGYRSTPTRSDLGYNSNDESLGYGSTPSNEALGYGDDADLGYGFSDQPQQNIGYGGDNGNTLCTTNAAPIGRKEGARRRCSVTKYSLDTPTTDKVQTNPRLSRSTHTVATSDESSSYDDDSEEDFAFEAPVKEEQRKKKKGGRKLFGKVRRAMSAI